MQNKEIIDNSNYIFSTDGKIMKLRDVMTNDAEKVRRGNIFPDYEVVQAL